MHYHIIQTDYFVATPRLALAFDLVTPLYIPNNTESTPGQFSKFPPFILFPVPVVCIHIIILNFELYNCDTPLPG